MTNKELEEEVKRLRPEINRLKGIPEKSPDGEIWKPKEYEEYFYIQPIGDIAKLQNYDSRLVNEVIDFGNAYKTREDAEKMTNFFKYYSLFKKYVEEHDEKIEWQGRVGNDSSWYIWYDDDEKCIKYASNAWARELGCIYATNEQVLKDAIQFVGEDNIKKYIFGVED